MDSYGGTQPNTYSKHMTASGLRPDIYSKLIIQDKPGTLINSDYIKKTGLRPNAVSFTWRLVETNESLGLRSARFY